MLRGIQFDVFIEICTSSVFCFLLFEWKFCRVAICTGAVNNPDEYGHCRKDHFSCFQIKLGAKMLEQKRKPICVMSAEHSIRCTGDSSLKCEGYSRALVLRALYLACPQ